MNYECCYASGSQFVFEERERWITGYCYVLMVAFAGLFGGLFVGMTVSFGGVHTFDVVMLLGAMFAAGRSYHLCFRRTTSSVDVSGYIIVCLLIAALLSCIWGAGRYSLLLDMGVQNRCMLLSALGLGAGVTIYVFALACCQADERKHHLVICSDTLDAPADPEEAIAESDASCDSGTSLWALVRYLALVYRSHRHLLLGLFLAAECEDVRADGIVVHNQTLKQIKVCLYLSADMFCWVPLGGISGHCVGFIQAEQCRTFKLPQNLRMDGGFKLKVFQPGLFDKELACFPKAQLGQNLSFHDVEGMMKRSRKLCSDCAWKAAPGTSSESELEASMVAASGSKSNVAPARVVDDNDSSCLLKRNSGGLRFTKTSIRSLSSEVRRAAPNEVVVRNRSCQEIRVLLFRSTDYSYVMPLVGHALASCGDCILTDGERRFNPKGPDEQFTVKVYSVGASGRELTYLTVHRGQAYTFCDSLLF